MISLNDKADIIAELKKELKQEIKLELKLELKAEIKSEIKQEILNEFEKTKANFRSRDSLVTWLEEEVHALYDRVYELEIKVEQANQYNRRNNVEINGLPAWTKNEDLQNVVVEVLNKVVMEPINPETEIEACHHIGGKGGIKGTVVRFMNRKRSEEIIDNRDRLKTADLSKWNTNIFINDNLNPFYKRLHYKCRQLKRIGKIRDVDIVKGRIKILGLDNVWLNVEHTNELMNLFPDTNFETL